MGLTLHNGSITGTKVKWPLQRRLLSGNDPLCALDGGEGDKTTEAAAFQLRRLLQQPTFFLGVVGEHFRSKWGLAGAPGRNVIPFGHRTQWYYCAAQQRYYSNAILQEWALPGQGIRQAKLDSL